MKLAWQEGAETSPIDNTSPDGVAQSPKAGSTPSGEQAGGAGDTSDESLADEASVKGPVPRVCMDYFYVSSPGKRQGVAALSTKELKKRFRELGKSDQGARNVLVKRYEAHLKESGDPSPVAESSGSGSGPERVSAEAGAAPVRLPPRHPRQMTSQLGLMGESSSSAPPARGDSRPGRRGRAGRGSHASWPRAAAGAPAAATAATTCSQRLPSAAQD